MDWSSTRGRKLRFTGYVIFFTFVLGILIQILGVLLLSKTVSYEDGKLKVNQVFASISDSLLTIANFSPHLVLGHAVASQSEIMRLAKIADLGAQMIEESKSILTYFSTSQELNDFLRRERGSEKIQETADKLSPIASSISKFISGDANARRIDEVFGMSTAKPIHVLNALLELGQNSEMLFGCETESKFLLLLTSSAEARSLGGLIGQYATISSKCGEFKVDRVGTNTDLIDNKSFNQLFELYPGLFRSTNSEWVNSNLIPDGLTLSKLWIEAFEKQFQEDIDGVIVVDTLILSKFAAANGGLSAADGTKLKSSEEIEAYLLNGIYFQFPENQILRKQHLLEITEQLASSLKLSSLDSGEMSKAVFDTLGEDRILVFLDNGKLRPNIYNQLSWSGSNLDTVYVGVNNLSGSKFDYYSKYSIEVLQCQNNRYLLNFRLSNVASNDINYPDYVARRLDSYNSNKIGVLNQFIMTFDPRGAKVLNQAVSPFSDIRLIQGETNRNLLSIVEFIESQESYSFSILFKSRHALKFRMWGHQIQVSNSKSSNCLLTETN